MLAARISWRLENFQEHFFQRILCTRSHAMFWTLVFRAVRLRCPWCGQGKLFRNWIAMRESCQECGASFKKEPGFFLGSIYFNYGLTALVVAVAYPILLFTRTVSNDTLLGFALAFSILFPVWFFRYARSLWLGFDQYVDPRQNPDEHRKGRGE